MIQCEHKVINITIGLNLVNTEFINNMPLNMLRMYHNIRFNNIISKCYTECLRIVKEDRR